MKKQLNIILPDGTIIKRVPHVKALGNFCQLSVVYNGKRFAIGNGDEYMHGMPDCFELSHEMTGTGKIKWIIYGEQMKRYAEGINKDSYTTLEEIFK